MNTKMKKSARLGPPMKALNRCLLPALILLLPVPAPALWPTTVRENLPVAADPADQERYPSAIPYGNGRTFVAFGSGQSPYTNGFQIITRYGGWEFSESQPLAPADPYLSPLSIISDDYGGAIAAWYVLEGLPNEGTYVQRVDSLGNLLWGDTGIEAFPNRPSSMPYNLCPDGGGGCFVAAPFLAGTTTDVWLQHVTAEGELPWGPSGILAYGGDTYTQRYPELASDGQGGCYLAWEDWRPPYSESTYLNRFNSSGQPLWGSGGQFVFQGAWFKQLLPDGQGGVMLHISGNVYEWNDVYRFDPNGNVLWQLESVSKYYWANMIAGEPGYFYIRFTNNSSQYAQRIDLQGNTYWPTLGSLEGILVENSHLSSGPHNSSYYQSPFLYTILVLQQGTYSRILYVQKIDSLGNLNWGSNGTLLGFFPHYASGNLEYADCCPDELGGAVVIYQSRAVATTGAYDVMAKRCNADGTLGGPFPLEVALTPQGIPIQIPPGGGSFSYDLALADTTPVGGLVDAWIKVTLPDGSALEVSARNNISLQPGQMLSRTNLQQYVPAGAPPGTYTYTVYAGDHDYNSSWGQDSLTFEKLSGPGARRLEDTCWALNGFSDDPGETVSGAAPSEPLQLLSSPNPFNPSTVLRFELPVAAYVKLEVFDVNGRHVGAHGCAPAVGFGESDLRWYSAGTHEITFDGSDLPSGVYIARLHAGEYVGVQKMVMIK